jgi:hypothetical protein
MYNPRQHDRLLTVEDFAPLVGALFQVDTDPEPVAIRLESLSRRPRTVLSHRDPFVLLFSSPPGVLLVDGVYLMRCGRFGPHAIALAPTTPEPLARMYQAVFG